MLAPFTCILDGLGPSLLSMLASFGTKEAHFPPHSSVGNHFSACSVICAETLGGSDHAWPSSDHFLSFSHLLNGFALAVVRSKLHQFQTSNIIGSRYRIRENTFVIQSGLYPHSSSAHVRTGSSSSGSRTDSWAKQERGRYSRPKRKPPCSKGLLRGLRRPRTAGELGQLWVLGKEVPDLGSENLALLSHFCSRRCLGRHFG